MNILIVDDQSSIINGLMAGVHFRELGFDIVRSATSTREALEVFEQIPVDVLLTDIEMPGENGLVLNHRIKEKYPDTLRILLTSHADFSYAQESIKLACFDYLVQPVPYDEIEESLCRAAQQLRTNRQDKQLSLYGKLFKTNETELMDHTVLNLYSRMPQDVQASVQFLNQLGYPIRLNSTVQLLLVDVFSFRDAAAGAFSEKDIRAAFTPAFKQAHVCYPVFALNTINPLKQFVILLFSETGAGLPCTAEQCTLFFEQLCNLLGNKVACYVGTPLTCNNLRGEIKRIHTFVNDNINSTPGLYFTDAEQHPVEMPTTLPECVARWQTLLAGGHRSMLESEIYTYLEKSIPANHSKFRNLCELHQQLTQIFFSFFYDNNIDMHGIFTADYSYSDYMDSFKNIDTLKSATRFMLNAIETRQQKNQPQSDVEKAKNFIITNLSKVVSVKDVAEQVNLSAEYFTKLFKKETGQNIKDFIIQSKVSAAKDLLEHSNISVSMVALELGYDNFSHFTQIFKKHEALTPSEYRKRCTER